MSHLSRKHRQGMSVIELLVVTAIIGVLIAILLPAIHMARESASRTRCTNNLRQMGLACIHHHDNLGVLPTAGGPAYDSNRVFLSDGTPALANSVNPQSWSWGYQILPYVEQDAIWREPDDAVVRATFIPLFNCPTKRTMQFYNGDALIDYASNSSLTPRRVATEADLGVNPPGDKVKVTPVKMADITDGTTFTLLVAEKYVSAHLYYGGEQLEGWWGTHQYGDLRGIASGGGWDTTRHCLRQPRPDTHLISIDGRYLALGSPQLPGDGPSSTQTDFFGGPHPGVFNCAFADGSVRPVRYAVDLEGTWKCACTHQDGQNINLGDF